MVDTNGKVLWNSLIRARKPVERSAQAVHHIGAWELLTAPEPSECGPSLKEALDGRMITAYNAEFDLLTVNNTLAQAGLTPVEAAGTGCIMELYARWHGERYWRDNTQYLYHKLEQAAAALGACVQKPRHRALSDALLALAVLKGLAGS